MNRDSDSIYNSLRDFNGASVSTAFGICAVLLSADSNAQTAPSPAPQSTPATTNAPAVLPDVVVTGDQSGGYKPESIANPKIAAPLRDTPQTINVVPNAVIRDQNATTLRDVLRNVSGITYQAGEGGVPAGDQLAIRGFGARTDIFIDGVRDVGGYTRDAFNVEQVEVFKGPNSAYSGRGSTGGSVNMVSKAPKLNAFYNADVSYGSDDYYRGTLDLNQPIKALDKYGLEGSALRFNALYHDQDFANRDYVHDNRWALNPTFVTGLGTSTRITLSYLHLQENNLAGYGLPFVSTSTNAFGGFPALGQIAPVPYKTFFGLVNRDYEDLINDIGGIKFEHDFSEDLKLQNQTRYARTTRDSVITAPRFVLPVQPTNGTVNIFLPADPIFGPNTSAAGNASVSSVNGIEVGLNHELQSRDQEDEIISNQTDVRYNFDTGRFQHALITSLEYAHETEKNYLRSAGNPTPFPFPAQTSIPSQPNPFDPYHPVFRTGAWNAFTSDSVGLSAFDTINITDQWILSAGARGDVFSTEYKQRAVSGAIATFDRTDIEPTWRTGLAYKPRENGSIYFGYGTSFNPSAEGLTLTGPTEALPPEYGRSYELGTKWDFGQRLSVAAAMFRTEKDNYRNTDPTTGIITVTGDVRVQGIEFGANGKITDDWAVFASYTLQESEILKSKTLVTYNGVRIPEQGKSLNYTPSQTASLWTTYALPFNVTIGTGFSFTDERFSNTVETQWVRGYWLQDAMITYHAMKNLDLRLNLSNLWDEEYIDRVGGGHAIPGTGRTVIMTASLKF